MAEEGSVATPGVGGSWTVTVPSVILGLFFVALGGAKLAALDMFVAQFQAWGYPTWFVYVVGFAEIIGGSLLFIPSARVIGAVVLILVMIGAAGTHILAGQWVSAIVPVVILLTLVWITRRMAWLYQQADLAANESMHASSLSRPPVT
jgi:uncharacterized membrane protein YphA (DoxX/SURF4 family)